MSATIYVGPRRHAPIVSRLESLDNHSPSEFKEAFYKMRLAGYYWTNNPYIVDLFPPGTVPPLPHTFRNRGEGMGMGRV